MKNAFFQFNPMAPLNTRDSAFIARPQQANQIHCFAFVLDASEKMQPEMVARLKAVKQLGMQLGW